MKVSLQWLNDYIDIKDYMSKPQELADALTAAGLEIEAIENLAVAYRNVVIGHLLSVEQHPNADRLTLCQVSTGEGVVHQIVCGAKNHKKGDRVVVALPGAVLPGDFEIKRSKIRGVESNGMLCSTSELALAGESEGILILPEDAPIGTGFANYWGLNDIIFEVNVTANRADCLSHIGLARELSAILNREWKFPEPTFQRQSTSTQKRVKVDLRDSERCPRYAGCLVENVRVQESPDWMKKRLERVGINSINNIVDITNYVLMELGQPLHAFDVRFLKGEQILIESSRKGEKFQTLDGTELTLTGEELTIRDGSGPVALAGVVGGLNSGVKDDTQTVFIESAYFLPQTVRRTSRRFGFETDSSYRFSRGVNPEGIPTALDRACQLMVDFAGGQVASDPYDHYPQPVQKKVILVAIVDVSQRLGFEASSSEFVEIMRRLGCQIEPTGEDRFQVVPPSYRVDLVEDVDLIEEYARLHGYQDIPEKLPVLHESPTPHVSSFVFENRVRNSLTSLGYLEAFNYAFTSSEFQSSFIGSVGTVQSIGLDVPEEPVRILNPLNEDQDVMRTMLLPGLVKNVQYNSRQGIDHGRIFEIGQCYRKKSDDYAEQSRLSLAIWGRPEGLWEKSETPLVLQLKSAVEGLLQSLRGKKWHWSVPQQAKQIPEFVHSGQVAFLTYEGKTLGFIGRLHPLIQERLKIRQEVALAELNLELLAIGQPRTIQFKPISKFPPVERDLSFVLKPDVQAGEIAQSLQKWAGPLCRKVDIVDVFAGESLKPGERAVAYRLVFQDEKGTLEDEQINTIQQELIQKATSEFPVYMR